MRDKIARLSYALIQIGHKVSPFLPLEVVGRGSETQLQVGEKSSYIA